MFGLLIYNMYYPKFMQATSATDSINMWSQILALAEKYGLSMVMALIFGTVLYSVFRAMRNGELVPKERLQEVIAERDEAQQQLREITIQMQKEREQYLTQLLGYVGGLKQPNSLPLNFPPSTTESGGE